jgi:hypothetical protein
MVLLIGISTGYAGRDMHLSESMVVRCSVRGVQSGWCMYPLNFDPIWIEQCTGFEALPEKAKSD